MDMELVASIRARIGAGRGVLRYRENGIARTFATDGECVIDGTWDICYRMVGVADAPWQFICSHADFLGFTPEGA